MLDGPSFANALRCLSIASVITVASNGAQAAEASATSASAAVTVPAAPVVPLYRTRLPGPLTLAYQLTYGRYVGNGSLQWRPSGDRYELRLRGGIAGLTLIEQVSNGTLNKHGLEPERYGDKRIRRPEYVAQFEKANRRVTFSHGASDVRWAAGSQDRLSWMMQLTGIVNAEPPLLRGGRKITLYVIGSRGEADEWTFSYSGTESLADVDAGGGTPRAAKFVREPRKPHDRRVEIWIDLEGQHLPLKARQSNEDDSEVFELALQRIESTP